MGGARGGAYMIGGGILHSVSDLPLKFSVLMADRLARVSVGVEVENPPNRRLVWTIFTSSQISRVTLSSGKFSSSNGINVSIVP
nr:hypothetical protein [Tanacetum cinerariifolium]